VLGVEWWGVGECWVCSVDILFARGQKNLM
jgi:hypothetical protein